MLIRSIQVVMYIAYCIKVGAKPWQYFQLNAPYFNEHKGIFSKLEINQLIPKRWRLPQSIDRGQTPECFPVFIKPEWGQNGQSVYCAKNLAELTKIRASYDFGATQPMIQQATDKPCEFEVFSILSHSNHAHYATCSVTQVTNRCATPYPVNSAYCKNTVYTDISGQFSTEELGQLWGYLVQIRPFKIARFCLRSHSKDALLSGDFEVIEINLFVPMPLALLAVNHSFSEKIAFIKQSMKALAYITKTVDKQEKKSIVMRKLFPRKNRKIFGQKKV